MSKKFRPRLNDDEYGIIQLFRAGKLDLDPKMAKEISSIAKSRQSYMDKNRVERAIWRDRTRLENALTEYNAELVRILKKEGLASHIKGHYHEEKLGAPKMILQLSDLHLNELVEVKSNRYDFYVAAKRLKKLADETIAMGKFKGATTLVVTFGGDMLNSDRRLDEKLRMATNRAKATQLAIVLLSQFLVHLNQYFNLYMAGVTGNESRANLELGFSEILATDNYDYTIYDTLRLLFAENKGMNFAMMKGNEEVIKIEFGKNDFKNVLLIHGHQLSENRMQKSIQEIMGRYNHQFGIGIDFILCGHIHNAYISDYFARNASMVGSNPYSEEALNFVSKASQNIHIFYPGERVDSMKIDLQNVNDYEGYPMEKHIDAYNAKSLSKNKVKKVIIEVVV